VGRFAPDAIRALAPGTASGTASGTAALALSHNPDTVDLPG
jgi:hypothetical protein